MCVPGCQRTILSRLSRRALLKGAGGAGLAGLGAFAATLPAAAGGEGKGEIEPALAAGNRVQDLTHTLSPDFPTFFGTPGIEKEPLYSWSPDKFNAYMWHVLEHCGTHLDAPLHFTADGPAAADIPAASLVLPLAVIDIRDKAAANSDYQLTPDDVLAWEGVHGALPPRACVAMYSGWEEHIGGNRYRNADQEGLLHFPGFHPETADLLMSERDAMAIAVDTLSLDAGISTGFDTHYKWLPSGRYGLESVANLGAVPASGATLIVGAPKVAGASGGPTRLLALY
ncbi:MAG: cyclase family protein [Rhodobiaceae bacterium]|nr:cyclase family protein [Rhodobiaceae bacterium]